MIQVTFAGTAYNVPVPGDAFTQSLSDLLAALASKAQPTTTALAADWDLGATYGIKSVAFKSRTTNPAAAGIVRLAKSDSVSWRNNANGADLALGIDTSDNLTYGGAGIVALQTVAPPTWIAPSLLNSWANNGAPGANAGYYRDAMGMVHLQGLIKSGTAGTTAFTLPVGYRPLAQRVWLVMASGGIGSVLVDSSGNVQPANVSGSNVSTYVYLEGVHFRAEA